MVEVRRISRGAAAAVLLAAAACQTAGPRPAGRDPTPPPPLSTTGATAQEQREAAELLTQARAALSAGDAVTARRLAEQVVERYPGTTSSSPALLLAARAAHAAGDYTAAVEMAERYAGLFPPGSPDALPAVALADSARAALDADAPVIVGAILPQSGSPYLKQYADQVLEGIRLAAQRDSAAGGRPIELVVLDDAGDPALAAAQIRELERRGAVAVVGPLLGPSVAAAAQARSDSSLVLISPTATDVGTGLANVYTLAAADTRGAEALASYAARTGLHRVAILYPRTRQSQADAFAAALHRLGGRVVTAVPYDSGTTTFGTHLRVIAEAAPQALFVPAPERDVRQIAPQIAFYGLSQLGVQVLGTEAWASEEVRRLVDRRYLDGVVAATPLHKPSPEMGWQAFTERYESTYRRSLTSELPALGYDAVQLLIQALGNDRPPPAELARRVASLAELRGATGILSIRDGGVTRRPFLVRIEAGELIPIGAHAGPEMPPPRLDL
ncbi:MAG TPA: ABC transporter substrate-binding protein [Longimicrobiales bacterium]